jgi:hypothetical protein
VGVEAAPCAVAFKITTERLENLKAIQSFKHAILQSFPASLATGIIYGLSLIKR